MIEALSADLKTGLTSVEAKFSSNLKAGLTSLESKLESTHASVDATANSIHTLNAWKSGIDTQVSDLSSSVQALRKQVDRVVVGVGLSALGTPPSTTPGAAMPPAAPTTTNVGTTLQVINSGQGHGVIHDTRGQTAGTLAFPLSTPVTGTTPSSQDLSIVPTVQQLAPTSRVIAAPPQTDFPRFDGENPRLWQKAAEKYFRLFSVDTGQRVEYATMHFTGNAAMWLQSVENQLETFTWELLCDKLSKNFDHGQYQMLYRQVFRLKQNGTVGEYVEKFNTLRHHMIAYKPDLDPTFFVTRFIEGLASPIRAVVMIHRPEELDTAVSLALLQEEIEDDAPRNFSKPNTSRSFSRHTPGHIARTTVL